MQNQISKPFNRSKLRKTIGKEYFIAKRKINLLIHNKDFALINNQFKGHYSVIKHQSFLLRPLKDVEMYLQHNKTTNLKLAIEHINGVVIKPGEVFSIWKMVGRPTKNKGYLEGLTLENGKISKGIGGGLCQLGNLLYWMALHSPLTIKERWRHSYDAFPDINRTIPFACGATLSYNYIDLQLSNNTEFSFQINLKIEDGYLKGEMICDTELNTQYEIFETDHLFQHQWWGGYTRHNKIWKRIFNKNDNTQQVELVTENNAIMMYNPMLEG